MNTLTEGDKAHIAFLTGNRCYTPVWSLISTYGVDKVYGGTGAPTHLTAEEQDEYLEMWEMQYDAPEWKNLRNRIRCERICCERCGSTYALQLHHKVYLRDKMLWEYEDNQLELLCKKCHLNQHGFTVCPDGRLELQ